jgi:CRP-like cAMP-binding protein
MQSLAAILRTHPVFASLSPEDLNFLVKLAVPKKLQPGQVLASQGDVWPYLFFVTEGELDALKCSRDGRTLLITTFRRGELFWGLAFFQANAPLLATLEATCPSQVVIWPRQQIETFFIEHGQMSWELCLLMIQRMQRASAIVEDLAFQSVSGRLAHLLLSHFDAAGEQAIERSLTLDEMANRIGTTREMVCRVLYRFADKKLINVTRTEFVLTDRDGLARLADDY